MKILHVLSQLQPTGAESYAATLANKQIADGHSVFIISDKLHVLTMAEYVQQPVGNRQYLQRVKNILFIRSFIKKNKIDIVHAHSRAASWVCYFSLWGLNAPLISTIHGRQHLHTSTSLFSVYGDKLLPVCENLKTHLIEEVKIKTSQIRVIPNGLLLEDLSHSQNVSSAKQPILLIAGRTTGPKGERTAEIIKNVLPDLLSKFNNLKVQVIGGKRDNLGKESNTVADKLNEQYANCIEFIEFTNKLKDYISESTLVIAAGRTAIESLWLEKPLIAFGESCYHGIVNKQNAVDVIASNFGDIISLLPVPDVDYEKIKCDITHLLENPVKSTPELKQKIEDTYNIELVYSLVMNEYRSAIMKKHYPAHIPVLMYHKIPDKPIKSQHRIFVTMAVFEKHMLFIKKRGFTPITFKDYHNYKTGRKEINQFPKKPVFITFDDAYQDNLTNALPILEKYGFRATVFSLGDEKHTHNFWDTAKGEQQELLLNTAQKLEMQSKGIEFGAHSMNHVNLTTLPVELAFEEIYLSKINLEKQLGAEVISFAYPYGKLNDAIKHLTQKAGFQYAVAIDSGGMHLEDDPLEIFRAYIFPEDDNYALFKKTSRWYRSYFKWKRKK